MKTWTPDAAMQREVETYRCSARYISDPSAVAYARALDGREIPPDDVLVGEPDPADAALLDGRELPEHLRVSFMRLPEDLRPHVAMRYRAIRPLYGA